MLKIKTNKGVAELTTDNGCNDTEYCADCICAIRAMLSAPAPHVSELLAFALFTMINTGDLGEDLPQTIYDKER